MTDRSRVEVARVLVRWVVALGFVGIGITHFAAPEPFVRIVPDALPFPHALVYISGAAEILGGVGLLIASTRRIASWGLLFLLFAVFPANINMAVHEIYLEGMPREPWLLWVRLPVQLVFAAVVYWIGVAPPSTPATPSDGIQR